jgi:hypothetical protein
VFGFDDPVAILVVMTYEERFGGRELKFLVLPRQVQEVLDWARRRLAADRHATMGPYGDRYRVTTLYFDTPGFDVFGRQGSYARAKYRIRRYGDGAVVFMERKLKTRCVVSKRRSLLELEELPSLLDGALAGGSAWFGRRLAARDLRPVCTVSYTRTALTGTSGGPLVRMTLDEELSAIPYAGEPFDPAVRSNLVAPGTQILELKYSGEMPQVFRELLTAFPLMRRHASKYRESVRALGLVHSHA